VEGKVTVKAEPGSEEIIDDLENQTIFAGGRNGFNPVRQV
jgi:hypothetical protein